MAQILARWQVLSLAFLLISLELIGTAALWTDDAQIAVAQSGEPITWRSIFRFLFEGRQYPGFTRGDVCAIAPITFSDSSGGVAPTGVCTDLLSLPSADPSEATGVAPIHSDTKTVEKVWAAQPLFIWKGEAERIQVRRRGEKNVLWQQSLTAKNWHIRYQGKPLQPGQTYTWELLDPNLSRVYVVVPFQVVTDAEQKQVAKALTRLDAQLRQQKATPETLMMHRANYFAERQLVSDALGEMMKVSRPAVDFDRWRTQTLTEASCKTKCAIP